MSRRFCARCSKPANHSDQEGGFPWWRCRPWAQRYVGEMTRPPVSTIADQLFYSTVQIEARTAVGVSTGTGFLLQYAAGRAVVPVLVTNKHVLAGATTVSFTLAGLANGEPMMTGTRLTMTDFSAAQWTGHVDPQVDVATMAFGGVLQQMIRDGAPAFYRAFGSELLLTSEQADGLDSIEGVTFVGYPNGLFDRASMLPIARRGQTATPIFNNYEGLPAFLIDASVFPGSSGSPVLIFDRGMYTTRDGNMHVASRIHVAGVIAAVHTRRVHGQVQIVSSATAVFDDMIDLGIVYKASAIQACVDLMFETLGVDLANAPSADDLA